MFTFEQNASGLPRGTGKADSAGGQHQEEVHVQTLLLSGQGIWLSPASRGSVSTREHMSCSPGGEACRHPTREKIQGCTVPPLPVDKDSGLVSFQVSRMK